MLTLVEVHLVMWKRHVGRMRWGGGPWSKHVGNQVHLNARGGEAMQEVVGQFQYKN
ncbi:hypothetical protein HanXRQr2_Chr06g0248251 [Helianthus annuus]|uniref:Uncharacterized protein n=1 Tax=Helianthus annuus TaxID=4232 RepID=A0A251UJF4_HELAN|nr:hypothetical protein HanXRQr2_Chr06g0248251 [Helianthus annuus]